MENQSLPNEKELLQKMSQDCENSFEQIYHYYSKRLFGKLIKLVKCEVTASELLQNTFVKVWVNRKNINVAKSFRSYLFQIVINEVYDFYRKAARDKKLQAQLIKFSTKEHIYIEQDLQCKEISNQILQTIESLPPQRREVYKLCKLEDKTYKEVSIILGISCSTISDHVVKANQFIRDRLSR